MNNMGKIMVNAAPAMPSKETIQVFDLAVLRLSEMDLQTGTVYKTYADICKAKQKLAYVVESSCGKRLRISECGKTHLTVGGEAVNDSVIACTDYQAAPFVVVAGLATNAQHPTLRLVANQSNLLTKYKQALQSDVVHSPTFAKAILDFFTGITQAVVCPIADLAQIDLLLIDAIKSRFQVSYSGVDTPHVVIHNGILAAKAICS